MKVISTERIPVKMWLGDIEDGALQQAKNLANLPFAYKWISIMSDAHQGYGMPIGGVMATKGVVVSNAVGVDIGCGMCTIRTSLRSITPEQIKKIFGGSRECHGGIRSCIPTGFSHQSKKQDEILMPVRDMEWWEGFSGSTCIVKAEYASALKQIGTLGGGNHFIEIQKGSDEYIWIMVHSGSRNIGFKVARYYNDLAKEINAKWYSSVDSKVDLAFLPLDSKEGQHYLEEMNYCLDFARANRDLMMKRIKECFLEVFPNIDFLEYINIHHNYARLENHYGDNVMIHRKGATSAKKGQLGIIPGSMGTPSYIVKGLGNPESFESCSHGAGRTMSRKKAKQTLTLATEQDKMKGIVHGLRNAGDLDEAPGAYKDIQNVMKQQEDLVEILVKLTPLAVIKG